MRFVQGPLHCKRLHKQSLYFSSTAALLVLFALRPGMAPLLLPDLIAAGCATSSPSSGAYSVTICVGSPSSGATLAGNATVTATVSTSGSAPGVQRVVFYLDGGYLLTDYSSAYTFILPTNKWLDGSHSLSATATMRDGFVSAKAARSVAFSNGIATSPVNNNTFTPSSGRPANGSPFVVAAAGDSASGEVYAGKVASLLKSINPNLLLYMGDVYERGSTAEFYNWYGNSSTYFGALRAITDPTVGNHEYLTSGAHGYYDYWNNVPKYYSFNAYGWHFISLNSNSSYVSTALGSAQYNWLQKNLVALSPTTCTIVYYHHPYFNIGPEGPGTQMSAIWKLMVQYHVDIVLNGHDHDYQRWKPLDANGNVSSQGLTEFVVGSSGHGLQMFTMSDNRVVYANDKNPTTFGILLLTLHSSSASFRYENTSGAVLDSGTVPCVSSTTSAGTGAAAMAVTSTTVGPIRQALQPRMAAPGGSNSALIQALAIAAGILIVLVICLGVRHRS
jgi:Big-like domain-containing protein/calcineurin-like phosphoesterase family protein